MEVIFHLPVPVAMSSGEVEYISAALACMRASCVRMLIYNLKLLGTNEYNGNEHTNDTAIYDNN